MSTPIAGASGDVTIAGVVRSAGDAPLTSPITKRACVCFEVHAGLFDGSATQRGAQSFLVEDATGTALVIMDHFELALGDLERGDTMNVLDADINKVSGRLSDLKAEARTVRPDERRKIDAELRELKGVATLLCAIRAHRRGKTHVGKTLAGQERFIRERSKQYEAHGELAQMHTRHLQSYDTILAEGDTVQVEGLATQEPDPTRAAGYRGRAMRTVIRAPHDGAVRVCGEGSEAASAALAPGMAPLPPAHPEPEKRASMRLWLLFAVGAAIALYIQYC